jgi:hypothetical protein
MQTYKRKRTYGLTTQLEAPSSQHDLDTTDASVATKVEVNQISRPSECVEHMDSGMLDLGSERGQFLA